MPCYLPPWVRKRSKWHMSKGCFPRPSGDVGIYHKIRRKPLTFTTFDFHALLIRIECACPLFYKYIPFTNQIVVFQCALHAPRSLPFPFLNQTCNWGWGTKPAWFFKSRKSKQNDENMHIIHEYIINTVGNFNLSKEDVYVHNLNSLFATKQTSQIGLCRSILFFGLWTLFKYSFLGHNLLLHFSTLSTSYFFVHYKLFAKIWSASIHGSTQLNRLCIEILINMGFFNF